MIFRIDELKDKQVVCVKNGGILGNVSDIEFDTESGQLTAIVIFGKNHFLGLFGKENDIVIPWDEIEVIGNETILVNYDVVKFS